jgi:hypothetical protein
LPTINGVLFQVRNLANSLKRAIALPMLRLSITAAMPMPAPACGTAVPMPRWPTPRSITPITGTSTSAMGMELSI